MAGPVKCNVRIFIIDGLAEKTVPAIEDLPTEDLPFFANRTIR